MATARKFFGSNYELPAPPGMGDFITGLHCNVNDVGVISCWELTEAEKAEVARTGVVWLFVMGHRHPPVKVLGTAPMEQRDTDGNPQQYNMDFEPPPAQESVSSE